MLFLYYFFLSHYNWGILWQFFCPQALYFLLHLMSLGHCYPQLGPLSCTAGLCYLDEACRVLFIQISPFAHTIKTPWFSLVETCPNSVTFFEDSRSRLNGIYFNSTQKNPGSGGIRTISHWGKNSQKMHALPSELAGPAVFLFIYNQFSSATTTNNPINRMDKSCGLSD